MKKSRKTTSGSFGFLLVALLLTAGCGMPDRGIETGNGSAVSYQPAALYVELDSDWDLTQEDQTAQSAVAGLRLAPAEVSRPAHRPRPPKGMRFVTIDDASLTVASIGLKKLPPRQKRASAQDSRDGDGHQAGSMMDDRGQSMDRDSTEQGDRRQSRDGQDKRPVLPATMDPANFDEMIPGPLTLQLGGDRNVALLSTVALQEDAPYMAILMPGEGTTYTLNLSGSWSDSVTTFAFRLAVPVTRPVVVPLHSDPVSGEARIRLPLARGLARVHLAACIDFATAVSDEQGVYDLNASPDCALQRVLPPPMRMMGQNTDPAEAKMTDDREGTTDLPPAPPAAINCEGSEEFCAELEAEPQHLRDACVTKIEMHGQDVMVTVSEDGEKCLRPPHHSPHQSAHP